MNLPTLYKKTSTGASQYWKIESIEGVLGSPPWGIIRTAWGQIDGAEQITEDIIKIGKNIGKKNETTAVQQAKLEAQSKWEKQLKKGYVKSLDDAQAGKVDSIIEGGVVPMLAHKYNEHGEKIVYPAFAQPKFDGHRCIAVIASGKATLWTRTRKPITGLPHIIVELEILAKKMAIINMTLDGELYNHEYKDRFEELSSFIRTPEAKPGHEIVQYHVYDMASSGHQFERLPIIDMIRASDRGALVGVETISVADEDEMKAAFERFLKQGYEGLMVRNVNALYVNKRSYDLQKVKKFDDAEFRVTGVKEGRGKLAGHAIFICETFDTVYGEGPKGKKIPGGKPFDAKMKGPIAELKKYWDDPSLAIGRQLTVQFQGYTNKDLVPRFPVALRFKEDL